MEQTKPKFNFLSLFKKKNKEDKNKKHLTKKQQIIVYSIIGFVSLSLLITLAIILGHLIKNNIETKREYEKVTQIYSELTQEQIKLQDSEYASVYIEEGNRYIPSNNIVTEYTSTNGK